MPLRMEEDTDLRFIASVPEYSARESGGKWTYTARVSADDFYAAVDGDGDYVGNVYAVGVREAGSVAGSEIVTTVTTTTSDDGRRVVTTDKDGKVTGSENIYTAADVTGFATTVDSDVAMDGTDDDDDVKDNDFVGALPSLALPADDDGLMPAVRAEAVIVTFETDDGGTTGADADDDDVTTRTTVTEHTIVTLTKAGTAQVGTAEDPETEGVELTDDYAAAVPAGGKVQTFTTTDILVGRPGATIDGTSDADDATVLREDLGSPVPGTSVDVTIAIEVPDPG